MNSLLPVVIISIVDNGISEKLDQSKIKSWPRQSRKREWLAPCLFLSQFWSLLTSEIEFTNKKTKAEDLVETGFPYICDFSTEKASKQVRSVRNLLSIIPIRKSSAKEASSYMCSLFMGNVLSLSLRLSWNVGDEPRPKQRQDRERTLHFRLKLCVPFPFSYKI